MAGYNDVLRKQRENGCTAFEAVVALCREGQDVRIQGFGTFSKVHKEGRDNVENALKPGTFYDIPAKDVLKFKPSKDMDMSPPKPAASGRRR